MFKTGRGQSIGWCTAASSWNPAFPQKTAGTQETEREGGVIDKDALWRDVNSNCRQGQPTIDVQKDDLPAISDIAGVPKLKI